jgi:hypothetical protein
MHFYGMGKSTIDSMNEIEISGWLAMIPAIQEQFGERKEVLDTQPNPNNLYSPL